MNINFWNGYKVPPKKLNDTVILIIIIRSKDKIYDYRKFVY